MIMEEKGRVWQELYISARQIASLFARAGSRGGAHPPEGLPTSSGQGSRLSTRAAGAALGEGAGGASFSREASGARVTGGIAAGTSREGETSLACLQPPKLARPLSCPVPLSMLYPQTRVPFFLPSCKLLLIPQDPKQTLPSQLGFPVMHVGMHRYRPAEASELLLEVSQTLLVSM